MKYYFKYRPIYIDKKYHIQYITFVMAFSDKHMHSQSTLFIYTYENITITYTHSVHTVHKLYF